MEGSLPVIEGTRCQCVSHVSQAKEERRSVQICCRGTTPRNTSATTDQMGLQLEPESPNNSLSTILSSLTLPLRPSFANQLLGVLYNDHAAALVVVMAHDDADTPEDTSAIMRESTDRNINDVEQTSSYPFNGLVQEVAQAQVDVMVDSFARASTRLVSPTSSCLPPKTAVQIDNMEIGRRNKQCPCRAWPRRPSSR